VYAKTFLYGNVIPRRFLSGPDPLSLDKADVCAPAAPALIVVSATILLYGECMARLVSTTVRLDEEDVRALKRARAAGISASDLIRKGLRVVASRYYSGRRPPSTLLFESVNSKLGDESELFRDLED
jgi:Arc/MetJ-type ribon-helix-helix transcriptional regulator